jgi:hypothetical protein
MFVTGFFVGSILATAACLTTAALHWLVSGVDGGPGAVQPALVPLHVTGVSRASLN